MDNFSDRLKRDMDELQNLKSSEKKSAANIEFVSHSINLSATPSDGYAEILVKITPSSPNMIWGATLNKLPGDDGGQTFEAEEYFQGGDYYARVYFGDIPSGGTASATLTVIATNDFTLEVVDE